MNIFKNKRNGFTLIEIVIVVIIVGILTSLSVPRITGSFKKAYLAEALNFIGVINRAMKMCGALSDEDYTNCNTFEIIGVVDPNTLTGTRFNYSIDEASNMGFVISATLKQQYVLLDQPNNPLAISNAYAMSDESPDPSSYGKVSYYYVTDGRYLTKGEGIYEYYKSGNETVSAYFPN